MIGGMTTMWGMFSFNLTNGSMCHWPKYVKGDDMKWQIGWQTRNSPSISPYIVGGQTKGPIWQKEPFKGKDN